MKKIKNKKFIRYGLIPLLLLGLWFVLTFIQIILNDESITVIKENYYRKDFQTISSAPILKGEKRRFEITASQNNLGIITINFNTYDKYNYDTVIFRIKEKNMNKWLYEGRYNTRAFTSLPRYPFGFPLIINSKDKQYIIELESLEGTPSSSVSINTGNNILSTSYQFDKNKLYNNVSYLFHFLYLKTGNALANHYLLFTSSVYLYPLLFYIIWIFIADKFPNQNIIQNPYVVLIGIAVLFDCFIVSKMFDLVYIVISSIWGIFLLSTKRGSRESYISASIILCGCMLFEIIHATKIVETGAIWVLCALLVGLIINIYEVYFQKKFIKK